MKAVRFVARPCWQHCIRSRALPSATRFQSTTSSSSSSLSSALLARARATVAEHESLVQKLATSFDTASAKRQGEIAPIVEALKRWDDASSALNELKSLLRDPQADAELRQLAEEDIDSASEQFSAASQSLTTALAPRHPFADMPCLVEIRPGVGGGEAALFAADLLRMYQALCSRKGLRASLLKYEDAAGASDPRGSDSPLQEAILEVNTPGAYDILRTEAGVHRVQRVPATESKGRTHTSAASVLVLPSFPTDTEAMEDANFDDPNSDFYVYAPDVRIDVMRARGAGGQHVNTTDSAVRLTHMPTNTVVAVQESRSQHQNRAKAWQILRARLAQTRRESREAERLTFRRSTSGHGKTGRGDKIRTYNWGQQRVTDHRSGYSANQLDDIMEGGFELDMVMDSVRDWLSEIELEDLIAESESTATHVE